MKRIESRNNPIIKNIISLKDRRERREQKSFVFEGVHLLEEYLRAGHTPKMLLVREDVVDRYSALIAKADCEVIVITDSVYEKISDEKAPQGIFTVSAFLPNVIFCEDDCDELSKIKTNSLMTVDLQDNGNIGTIIRTSAALGCQPLLCGNCADVYSTKTIRATMGALFTSDIYVSKSPEAAVKALQKGGVRVIASALDEKAEILGNFEILKTDCFVVGNEGNGLSKDFIDLCDKTAFIPMTNKTESLNAASAASVMIWEARRTRL